MEYLQDQIIQVLIDATESGRIAWNFSDPHERQYTFVSHRRYVVVKLTPRPCWPDNREGVDRIMVHVREGCSQHPDFQHTFDYPLGERAMRLRRAILASCHTPDIRDFLEETVRFLRDGEPDEEHGHEEQ